jgi:hypothetical protein
MTPQHMMTLGQRLEILLARAARHITSERRRELLDLAEDAIGPSLVSGRIKNTEELFYLFAANALILLSSYCEEAQAEEGAKILRKEFPK